MRRIARTMVVALLGAMLLPAAPAWASRTCGGCGPTVLGRWDGSYQAVGDPNDTGAVALEITTQNGRRFGGTLTGLGGPDTIPVDGTLAESGRVTLVGMGPGVHVVGQGGVGNPNEGGVGNPDIFEGRFVLTGPDGETEGDLVLVHRTGVSAEVLAGRWSGTSRFIGNPDTRPLTLELADDGTGRSMLGDVGFIVNWSVGEPAPDGTVGFAAVGGGDAAIIIIGGTYTPPDERGAASLEGSVRLLPADGGPDQEGTFSVPPEGD